MRFGIIRPKWQVSSEFGTKSFQLYYGHPYLAGKRLARAMQCKQFRAKNAKNDLTPTNFLEHKFYFETEGACVNKSLSPLHRLGGHKVTFKLGKISHVDGVMS
jgi:hypothetical protein